MCIPKTILRGVTHHRGRAENFVVEAERDLEPSLDGS